MKIIWFFFSLCLLVGCKRSDVAVSVEQTLPVIDLNVAYPEKKLDLAEVASPEYIPLYTVGADSLDRYSLTSASVSPHWVVAYNWQQTIMVFERATGKLRYRFNHQGQQKEQYYYIFSVFVDEEREEIYVVGSVFKIQVYSLSGNYKRTLNLPYDMSFEQVFDYDKDSLIFNDGREDVDNPVQKGTYYYLMSKTDGGMRPLPFHVKYRITNRFRIRLRNGDRQGVISCMFSVKPLLKNGDEVILSEFSNDTVFSYGKEGAKPLLVRTPAPRSTFPLKLMSVSACSRRFLFLDVIEKVYRRNIKKLDGDSFVYDYREKEIFTPVLVNSDFIPELPVE
ncbi:6-bladed beta-propeller, partial [Bacteroides caccae]